METLARGKNGVQILAMTTLEEVAAAIALLEDLARAEGWLLGRTLRDSVQGAVFFTIEVGGDTVGGLQLRRTSAAGVLPCHVTWPELRERTRPSDAHVGVLLMKKNARAKHGALRLLGAELWRYCFQQGIEQVWLEATDATYKVYRRLGWPLAVAGPARPYCGDLCVPCTVRVRDVAAGMAQRGLTSPGAADLVLTTLSRCALPHPALGQPAVDGSSDFGENGDSLTPNRPRCRPSFLPSTSSP